MKLLRPKNVISTFAIIFSLFAFAVNAQIISTVVGNGNSSHSGDGGLATAAGLSPEGICFDNLGNMYIAANSSIRKVDVNGKISTVAGKANGLFYYLGDGYKATSISLDQPRSVLVDATGNIYIAEPIYNRILKVSTDGIMRSIAGNGYTGYSIKEEGGLATNATLDAPSGIALDNAGNLYIADNGHGRIRKVTPGGIITTIAGNNTIGYSGDGGLATKASLNAPFALAFDAVGNLYIADASGNRIRKIDAKGIITTVAGNGKSGFSGDGGLAINASFDNILGITVDASGNIYISDQGNQRIRKVDTNGIISTVAGNGLSGFVKDGAYALATSLSDPFGLTIDANGDLYICDSYNNRVRKFNTNVLPIIISSFNPVSATEGDTVTIKGRNFSGATTVYFGTTEASSFKLVNDSTITAVVNNGTSGVLSIYSAESVGELNGFTFIHPTPIISSFSPDSAIAGDQVTIKGNHFTGVTSVSFGGVLASSFSILSDSILTAIVGYGASGSVTVSSKWGSNSLAAFHYFIPPPSIKSFAPNRAAMGDTVIITGKYFTTASSISLGGELADYFKVLNDSSIIAIVGNGSSGSINVTTKYGAGSLQGFSYFVRPPSIERFTPTSTCPGTIAKVFLAGSNFINVTSVTVGGKAAKSFTVNSPTSMTAIIDSNSTGAITITTQSGKAISLNSFSNGNGYIPKAYITEYGDDFSSYFCLSVINASTKKIINRLYFDKKLSFIATSSDGSKVAFVEANKDSKKGNIYIMNTANDSLIGTVEVGGDYIGSDGGNNIGSLCISPDCSKICVSLNNGNLTTINTASNSIIRIQGIGNGGYPEVGVSFSPDGKKIYMVNSYEGYPNNGVVRTINPDNLTVEKTVTVGVHPVGMCVSFDGKRIYVANAGFYYDSVGTVSVINTSTNTVLKTISVGKSPTGINISPDGSRVYVTNKGSNSVSVIDATTNTLISTISVGKAPWGISVTPDGTKVYVVNYGGNNVSVINTATNTVSDSIGVGVGLFSVGNFIANVPTLCSEPQPVTIFSINAINKNGNVIINWHTSTELNSSHFTIQHSTDGGSFTDIGTVKAIGSGANGYQFTDNSPANGINYYRLKSVDKDGSFAYSKIVSAQLTIDNYQLSIYPNPSKSSVTIKGSHFASVQVIDNLGRVIKTQTLKDATNPTLSLGGLPVGVYHLRVQTTDGKVSGVGFVKE